MNILHLKHACVTYELRKLTLFTQRANYLEYVFKPKKLQSAQDTDVLIRKIGATTVVAELYLSLRP